MTMLERVASAISAVMPGGYLYPVEWRKAQARIAIEAMMEPTDKMIDEFQEEYRRFWPDASWPDKYSTRQLFRAMLKAALEEGK